MTEDSSFHDLMRRVRAGEEEAATELVQIYQPEIRRIVRVRLAKPNLQRLFDSLDICQSVLAAFFVRAANGQWDLETPAQLLKLLVTMARNKLRDQLRKQKAARRDEGPSRPGRRLALENVADPAAGPGTVAAMRELLHETRKRLSVDERFLADQRALGRDWAEIAAEVGGSAEALRKRLARALDRVGRELGFAEVHDDE
jgi:RNA polymerase sigma-70 factor (ECF subfamily)